MSSAILPLLVTITLISLSVYYFFFPNNKAAIGTETTSTTSTTTTTTVGGGDDEATADQEEIRNFGIGDGEELIEGTVTLTLGETKEEEEKEEARKANEKKKLSQQKEDSANGFDLGGLLGETMEKIKNKREKNKNVLTTNTEVVDDEKKEDDGDEEKEEEDDTKTNNKNKNVISYYHQAATNRKPGVEIHHIVLLHGQRFTKENWKTSGILSMFNRQFPSIAVTACNLTTTGLGGDDDTKNNHYLLLDLLDKLEAKGVISLPLSGLVTPSASGKTITDWLCEQIVDDDDDSTVVSEDDDDDEDEDNKKDDKKVKKEETDADEKEDVEDDDEDDEALEEEEEEDTAAKDEEEENDKKVDADKENEDNNTEKKIKIPLSKLLQYVRRWIPVASYNVMNCTKNQLRLLGAFTVCGEDDDNNNERDGNKNKLNKNKKFDIVAIYGTHDQGGSIVSKRLEKYSYAKVKELNGTHPVYLDSPDEFVPAIGWSIIL